MQIKILTEGGAMKPGPALSQKLGPLGINISQVIQRVNEATSAFAGLKVPVELDVNPKTKNFEIRIFSPPVAELLKKELGITKGSGAHKKLQVANASIEQIILIAKTKSGNLLSKDLKSAVKTVVGTCNSLGILIDNKSPKIVESEIDEGKYNKEINEGKTETSPEKKAKLKEFFDALSSKQQKELKAEEAAAAAASEEKKAEPAAPTAAAKPAEKAPAKK
jgi:large subunit ribosomal protein L11